MKARFLTTLLAIVIFGISCTDEFPEPRKNVTIDLLTMTTTLPGEVSIFFQVYDKKNQTPIAGLESDDFTIFEKGPNDDDFKEISAVEANSIIEPDNQHFVFSTMLVLDLSGSVIKNNLKELKESVESFIEEFMPADETPSSEMGIWWFDGKQELHELQDFTRFKSDLLEAIRGVNENLSSDPSTNLYGAVVQAAEIADTKSSTLNVEGVINSSSIVVFTDGTDQAAWNSQDDVSNALDDITGFSKILTIGLGDEIDVDVLKDIGQTGFSFAKNPDKLKETFTKIGKRISDEANSYYLFKYCSPKRNGSNIGLKIELDPKISDPKHKGSADTTFSAVGFTGC